MPDIFDEVEEDLRADRARALGRRYWGAVAALIVLTLVGTGVFVAWQQHRTATANAVATRFIAAARQADRAASASVTPTVPDADTRQAAATLADIGASGPAGYRLLARLRLAALYWQTGQHSQAIAIWQSVTDDAAAPPLLRDLATLTSAQHQAEVGDPVMLKQRLQSLTAPSNRWAPMAEQVIALIDLRTGRTQEAASILRRLSGSPAAPEGIRSMAADLLSTLPPAATPAAASPGAASPAAAAASTHPDKSN